jgi:hypothetical protein
MNSKKAITLLVLATLVMTLVPVLPVSAITVASVGAVNGGAAWTTAVYDETIEIIGIGVTSGDTINAYWDTVGTAYLLNSTTGQPDGGYTIWVDVPAAENGDHYIWIKDVETGQTTSTAAITINSAVELSEDEGLPGDTITVSGYGFGSDDDTIDISIFNSTDIDELEADVEADEDGYFSVAVEIPSWWYAANTTDLAYEIVVDGVIDNVTGFDIGPAISIDVDEGPSGTVVEITGRGFTADMVDGDVTLDGVTVCPVIDGDDIDLNTDGGFVAEVIIPNAGDDTDYEVTVDDGTYTATAGFEIVEDGVCVVEATPSYGAPGETVTINGYNFTQVAGTTVEVMIGLETVAEDVELDENGEFEVMVTLPALTLNAQHDVDAEDEYGLAANAANEVLIGVVTVLLSEYEGDVGDELSLTATGLEGGDVYNVTFGDILIYEDVADGGFTAVQTDVIVPDLDPGVYEISITDGGWGITVKVDYEIKEDMSLTLSPAAAPNGYNVTISAENWPEIAGGDITWNLYNDSEAWDISAEVEWAQAASTTNASGYFTAYWMVPLGGALPAELDLGIYYINATVDAGEAGQDDGDWYVAAMFEVVDEEWDISIKKTSYEVGDTITYNIRATFPKAGAVLEISDPDDYIYWVAEFEANDWVSVGDWETVPVGYQLSNTSLTPFTLSEDAPLGTWTWEMVDGDDDLESGVFEVTEVADNTEAVEAAVEAAIEASLLDVTAEIEALSDEIVDYSSSFDSVADDIAAVADVAADAVEAAQAAADAVTSVASVAGEAAEAAADAAKAANAAKDAASGLTTLVYGAIGAALVAALAAIVSLMQISRRIAG